MIGLTMSKKKKQSHLDPVNLPRRLRQGIEEADDLLAQGQPQEALELLQELDKKFPRQPDILGLLANAYLDIHDQQGYLHSIYKLHTLTPNKADVKLGLAGAYLANEFLALALQTFRQFISRWPNDEHVIDVRKTIAQLELGLQKILSEIGFSMETGFNFLCQHEELRLQMELGNYDRCRQLAKPLLEQRPHFCPVLNNLSLVEWLEGDLQGAIEISQKVLDCEPENVHALSNLTRYFFMLGRRDESNLYAQRLKQSQAEAADIWIKKTEALSFIGDDVGVLALIEQAKLAKVQKELSGIVWHWGAVAEYRMGQIAKARKYWQKSSLEPRSSNLARANLEELEKPLHERTCPQAFTIDAWISRKTIELMAAAVERSARRENDPTFHGKVNLFIDSHPELINFVLQALRAGDNQSREFALQLAEMSAHPKILSDLKEFMLGQQGPDALRLQASQVLSKHGIFKPGELVDIWLKGEWTAIMMFGMKISYDSQKEPTLKPAAQRLMEQAIYALQDDEGEKAEKYLRKALEIQGDEPGLLNNLAVSLSMQGRDDEAGAIADEIPVRFPDYFFGQVITVRKAIQENHLEEAKSMLDKMMQKTELHVTEFSALCACQVEFMIEDGKPDGAYSWFEIWEQGYPNDPQLDKYEEMIELTRAFAILKKDISKRGRKGKKAIIKN
jgi:tetratricopeptide (TPR) repeat protein